MAGDDPVAMTKRVWLTHLAGCSMTPWAAAKLLPAFDTSAKSIQFLT